MFKHIATVICSITLSISGIAMAGPKEATLQDTPPIYKESIDPKALKNLPAPQKEYQPTNPLYGVAITGVEIGVLDVVSDNAYALGVLGYCKGEQYKEAKTALNNQLKAFIEKSTELDSAKRYLNRLIVEVSSQVKPKDASKSRCDEYQKTAMEP